MARRFVPEYCLPSEKVIYSARVASLALRGAEFGLEMDQLRINIASVQQRKRKMVEAEHQFHAKRTGRRNRIDHG
jgi:pyruvate/2-oxoglutarate dehydrogenase complex dihydrolipoamide dehydrogenase (E3) component